MHLNSRALLLSLALTGLPVQAEITTVPITSVVNAEVASLSAQLKLSEQRLADSERLRSELNAQLDSGLSDQTSAQLARLQKDNQRLKMQVKALQAQQPANLFSEQQSWFAVGGGVALLAFIFGALARGASKKRRNWMS
jgi:SH3 domain protein